MKNHIQKKPKHRRSLKKIFCGIALLAGTNTCVPAENTNIRHGVTRVNHDECDGKIIFFFGQNGPTLTHLTKPMFVNDGSGKTERWQRAVGQQEILMRDERNVLAREKWYEPIKGYKYNTLKDKAKVMDAFIDRNIEYTLDMTQRKVKEHWAPPILTMADGKGDCEDIAWIKYDGLRFLGVEAERMYIFTVEDKDGNAGSHAVLAVNIAEDLNGPPQYVYLTNDQSFNGLLKEDKTYTVFYARNENGIWAVPKNAEPHWSPGQEVPRICTDPPPRFFVTKPHKPENE